VNKKTPVNCKSQANVPQNRKGDIKEIVSGILSDLGLVPAESALKVRWPAPRCRRVGRSPACRDTASSIAENTSSRTARMWECDGVFVPAGKKFDEAVEVVRVFVQLVGRGHGSATDNRGSAGNGLDGLRPDKSALHV
jgi:hypothetical protein